MFSCSATVKIKHSHLFSSKAESISAFWFWDVCSALKRVRSKTNQVLHFEIYSQSLILSLLILHILALLTSHVSRKKKKTISLKDSPEIPVPSELGITNFLLIMNPGTLFCSLSCQLHSFIPISLKTAVPHIYTPRYTLTAL